MRAELSPGEPTLVVDAILRGKGTGDSAWLSHYTLEVSSLCGVELFGGVTTHVDVNLVRRVGPFADFDEGIVVECESSIQLD